MQHPEHMQINSLPEDEVFSLKDEGIKFYEAILHALAQWRLLLLALVAGALLGLGYWYLKPITYTARTTFVVEDAKSSGSGMMAALAGQFGFDIGGLTGGGSGVLSGDNILQLLRSKSMVRTTLLTRADSGSQRTLADVYAETYGWKKKWKADAKINRQIDFAAPPSKLGRTEDSLLQRIEDRILDKELNVVKTDRKLSFIELTATMRNEDLSRNFCERILKVATDFYVDTKTRRITKNITRLQAKADSLERMLNLKTYSAANANRMLMDVNPIYAAPEVSAEISSRDKFVQSTIYAEIIKNLEMNKTAQIQETPTIQIVDTPEIPLKENRIKLPTALISGGLFAVLFTCVGIIAFRGIRHRNKNAAPTA